VILSGEEWLGRGNLEIVDFSCGFSRKLIIMANSLKRLETSETDPLRVDFLSLEVTKLPGKFGMAAIAPGRHGAGASVYWRRSLAHDLHRLRYDYQTDILVPLIEQHEMQTAKIPDLLDMAETYGMQINWFPIRDLDVPSSLERFAAFIDLLLQAMQQGKTVVTHCRGGLGRTGLLTTCCLVRLGYVPDRAIALVREIRPGAVETTVQRNYINRFSLNYYSRAAF
jgi:protein-tyrosine phosphatase